MLITLLLIERKLLPAPLLYLSAFFEATRYEYYKQLYNVSSKGTWFDWLVYFLNGVSVQSLDVLSRAERINALIIEWQIKVGYKTEIVARHIVKYLAMNPYFTTKKVAESLNISFSTARRAIIKLESFGIVSQTSEGKRDRVYCATDILRILEEPTKITENEELDYREDLSLSKLTEGRDSKEVSKRTHDDVWK